MKVSASVLILSILIFQPRLSYAQKDSIVPNIKKIPTKYLKEVNNKVDKYSNRISSKTENTLVKLSKWENKIHSLVQKADPAIAERLFGSGAITFSSMLKKVKEGKSIAENYKAQYDDYRDKLTTGINYMDQQKDQLNKKLLQPLSDAKQKIKELDKDVAESETVTKLIKERKQQLITASIKYIGKSKYLAKINKETYYYAETMRNYKEIFRDSKKAEETALTILHKIPAFTKFVTENSMLASLFGKPTDYGTPQSLAGLQTRASVNSMIQDRIAAGGPNAAAVISQNIQQAQAELNNLKDKIIKVGGGSSNTDIPDFKPNTQKTKTFKQRVEYNTNFNIAKPSTFQPNTADIALGIGYKLNDKSIIGLAASYKMGFGSIQNISITNQGVGLRSFVDWKLKKNFFVTGGYEMNYSTVFKNIATLKSLDAWQQSGLLGLSKKLKIKTKLFKETKFQLLYDMLHNNHVPITQPVIFRVGYNF